MPSERIILENGTPILLNGLVTLGKSACKVLSGRPGNGFLFKLRVPGQQNHDRVLYGFLTNHHVLDEQSLRGTIKLEFNTWSAGGLTSFSHEFEVPRANFRCTCRLLDFTFVEISHNSKMDKKLRNKGCVYLEGGIVETENDPPQRIVVVQHPGTNEGVFLPLSFAQGFIRENAWGTDVLHCASTTYGSSGSMIANDAGRVIALHRARHSQYGDCNIGVKIACVEEAIRAIWLRHHPQENPPPVMRVRSLTERQIDGWGLGLRRCSSRIDDCFSSEHHQEAADSENGGIGRVWFFRTCHRWFWTPTPTEVTANMDHVRECNWMRVGSRCVGGDYHDQNPPQPSQDLMQSLIDSEFNYL